MEYQRSSASHSSSSSYAPSNQHAAASNHVFTIPYSPPGDPSSAVANNDDSVERVESMKSFDLTGQLSHISSAPEFLGTYSFVHREYLNGEMVAVKVLRLVSDDVVSMRRKVRREREVWASLTHPNILPFYGFASDPVFGDFGALISPWCMEGDTDQFLRTHGTSMTPQDRIQFWRSVVSGVHYLHTRTPIVIHGDIKPGNVLVDDHGNPRLCDFGLVRIILDGDAEIGITPTSEHTGTPRYLSIELLKNEKARPTIASDVHALGYLGLAVIFSRKPHAQRKNNLRGGVIQDIKRGFPPAIRDNDLDPLDECAWSLLEQCWRLEPSLRPLTQAILAGTEKLLSNDLYLDGSSLRNIHVEETDLIDDITCILGDRSNYAVQRGNVQAVPKWYTLIEICLLCAHCVYVDVIMRNYHWEGDTSEPRLSSMVLNPSAAAILEALLLTGSSFGHIALMTVPFEDKPYPRTRTSIKLGSKRPLFRYGSLLQEQMGRVAAAAGPLSLFFCVMAFFSASNLQLLITSPNRRHPRHDIPRACTIGVSGLPL